jgi:tetratricopeptide (TPR) repeat protein
MLKPRALIILLLVMAVLPYAGTIGNEFVYDDDYLILQNDLIRRPENIWKLFVTEWWGGKQAKVDPRDTFQHEPAMSDRYRPMAMVSYLANHMAGGSDPSGYHLVNVLLHGGVTVLLFLMALELGWTAEGAFLAAALFGIHPLHSEAVAWVAARPELLMALGVLGGWWCALRGRYWLGLGMFALALFSKEQGVVLPVFVILTDVCRGTIPLGQASWGHRIGMVMKRYSGYSLVLAAYIALRMMALKTLYLPRYSFLEDPLEHAHGIQWVLSVVKMAGQYLWLAVWPAALSVDYSYNAIPLATTLWDSGVIWGLTGWGILIVMGLWAWGQDRRISLAVAVAIVTFAPVANVFVPVGTPMAERLFYLPLAGLCLLVGVAYERLNAAVQRATCEALSFPRRRESIPMGPRLKMSGVTAVLSRLTPHASRLLVALICLAFAVRTAVRVQDWRDNETLFAGTVRVVPQNAKAHAALGYQLMKKDSPDDKERAIKAFQEAITIYPGYVHVDVNVVRDLSALLFQGGRRSEALGVLEQTVASDPDWATAHYLAAVGYAIDGQAAKAEAAWHRALALRPDVPLFGAVFGRFLLEQGRYEEGLAVLEGVLRDHPAHIMALFNRALILEALGHREEAARAYQQVLAVPSAPEAAKREAIRKLGALRGKAPSINPAMCLPGIVGC